MSKILRFGNNVLQILENGTGALDKLFGQNVLSQYAPYFVDPVFKKEALKDLETTGEAEKLQHIPIKAAQNEDTCSVFHDELVKTFINHITKCGKKELARNLLEKTFENIKRSQLKQYHALPKEQQADIVIKNPTEILASAVSNSRPLLQLTPIKRGGVRYQVPVPVTDHRSYFLAIKWLLEAARDKERTVHLPEKLAWELMDAAANRGRVVKRKQDLHRQCEANRAYAHYRWS
ncbi:hypothetical protein B566_EDAN004049 [Ephemera danica]|nr:hypothetical protein B566_EDAN004049 [Ephemera danica]